MKPHRLLSAVAACAATFASPAQTATVSASFNVQVTLNAACKFNTGPGNVALSYNAFQSSVSTMRRAGPSRRTCGVAVRPRKALMAMASGPFAIDVPPLLGSDGQVRVVVRDLMGRETVIAQAMTSAIAHYALAVGPGTTLGLGMARAQPLNQAPIATYSVSVGKRLAGGASVNVIAARTQGQVSASQLTLAFQMPLPGQTAHTLHLARRNNALDAYVSASGSEDRTSWRVHGGQALTRVIRTPAEAGRIEPHQHLGSA